MENNLKEIREFINQWKVRAINYYHEDGRRDDTIYIHASKTRIIEIYNNLKDGKKLDGRGYILN